MRYQLMEEDDLLRGRRSLACTSFILFALSVGLLVVSPSKYIFASIRAYVEPPPYLSGWMQEQWITCNTVAQTCPMKSLDVPRTGCMKTASMQWLLLTADGLSSPHARARFEYALRSAAELGSVKEKRVLLVLDAAYDAFRAGTQFTDADAYCVMRKRELESLGASAVTCVLLDLEAREGAWRKGQAEGGPAKVFGDFVYKMDDDEIFRELGRVNAIFVECGSPVILAKNFRRSLNLRKPVKMSLTHHRSLQDIIRSRIHDPKGGLAYIGVSSGSSLAGDFMIDMSDRDKLLLGGDNSGLGLVPNCSFFPHIDSEDKSFYLRDLSKTYGTNVMAVPDCQPIADKDIKSRHLGYICP